MRRLTREPWFGPKKWTGWGWRPITWQGWVVTVALVASLVAVRFLLGRVLLSWVALVVVLLFFALLALLTGSRPGGPTVTG